MSKQNPAPSPKKELEATKKRAEAASLRRRYDEKVEALKGGMKRARQVAAANSGRLMQAVEVVAGGAIAGALEGAYPDAKLGPLDARKGFVLGAAAIGLYTGGKGMGAHALNLAEGGAASIASDLARDATAKWRAGKKADTTGTSATTEAGKGTNANVTAPAEGDGRAVSRLRQAVLSQPMPQNERQRPSGRGIPGRERQHARG